MLPGVIYSRLAEGMGSLRSLPVSAIPPEIRAHDGNFTYQPTTQLEWKNYRISIGDRVAVIGCKLPYPGWGKFREDILQLFEVVLECKLVASIERYSIRYVNLLERIHLVQPWSMFEVELKVGSVTWSDEPLAMRMAQMDGHYLHTINFASSAEASIGEQKRTGSIIDVETVRQYSTTEAAAFLQHLTEDIENIRLQNKIVFFDCLKDSAIELMEPQDE